MGEAARRESLGAGLAALAAFLPFAGGAVTGASFYFRDLSVQFFPVRRFVAEGLRAGELRFWNPYAHEGTPLTLLPLGYPPDLLHALAPGEAFFSLLLSLHLPLAALALYALARHLGAGRLGAACGGVLFALGGFALSTLNLYVYAQALPWVPLLVLTLRRAATGGRRAVALAALVTATALSTTAVEFAAQAVVVGIVLLPGPATRGKAGRVALALALGAGLAGFVLGPVSALVAGSARDAGFPADVVLAHSVHPVTLLQTVVAGLYGDPAHYADRFWGSNYFPRGFPYFLSLYLGLTATALAATGALSDRPGRKRLLVLVFAALVLCLGRWAGLEPFVEALSPLRKVRFPSKAFLTVHLAVSLLAALGLDSLARAAPKALRRFAALALGLGLTVGATFSFVTRIATARTFLLGGFFPPDMPWSERVESARLVVSDAAAGGAIAAAAGLLVALAAAGRVRARVAAAGVGLLLLADLLRAGAGLNPMVSPSLLAPSAEAARLAADLRRDGGRVFPLDPSESPAYYRERARRPGRHELWTFAVLQDTFAPDTNLRSALPTALTPDRTMLVPVSRVISPAEAAPSAFPSLVDRLRAAGVAHVLSLDPLDSPALVPRGRVQPPRIAPLALHVYRLTGARPLAELQAAGSPTTVPITRRGDGIETEVDAPRPGRLVVREAWAAGWEARVDGHPAGVACVEDGHLGVALAAGRHRVELRYRPPRFLAGLAASALCALAVAWLGRPFRKKPAGGSTR
jgi:hypothetical protein